MKRFLLSSVVVIIVVISFSCNDASILGSNILPAEENLEVGFTDTITLEAKTIRVDSTRVYDPNPALQPGRYITGRVSDPVFGVYSSNIYTQLELISTSPDFSNATLDSVVLLIAYDEDGGYYGDLDAPMTLKVREVNQYMPADVTYQSFNTFETSNDILGELTFTPAPNDSVKIDEELTLKPHIRIPLDNALGHRFFNEVDTTVFDNDDNFTNYFYGIQIEGALSSNQAMLGLDLLDNLSQLVFYYTEQDTIHREFGLRAKSGSTKSMNFNHTYDKDIYASINPFVDNATLGDSLVFLQAMEGHNIRIEMPYIESLPKVVINKAELIVRVAEDASSTLYPLPSQLVLSRERVDEDPVLLEDVTVSLSRTSTFNAIFGGQPEANDASGESITEYRMNISSFLQDVLDGDFEDNTLILEIFPKADQPNRVILGGAKHSKYNMSIELTFTKLD